MLLQLQADCVKDGASAQATLGQALLEAPQRACIRDVQGTVQTAKVLEAHAIKHLVLAVFVTEVVQRLDEQQAHHDFGGVRRATALASISARARHIDLGGNGAEVNQLIHRRQIGDEAAQLGLALVLHKQVATGLATPEGRGLDAWGDHALHHAVSGAFRMREVSRSAPMAPSGWRLPARGPWRTSRRTTAPSRPS